MASWFFSQLGEIKQEDRTRLMDSLVEPIDGITREERYEELESESFDAMMKMMGK